MPWSQQKHFEGGKCVSEAKPSKKFGAEVTRMKSLTALSY